MRLPLSKVYRAFPELDRFSDAECLRYIDYVSTRSGGVISGAAFITGLLGCVLLSNLTSRAATSLIASHFPRWRYGDLTAIVSLLAAGVGVMCGFIVRDIMLRRAIRRRLRTATCPSCDYPLLGLTVTDGYTTCPECGYVVELTAHDLTAADLVAERPPTSHPTSANPSDSP